MRTDCKVERVGEKFITSEGYEIEIIEYFSKRNCTIKFENGVILYNIYFHNIKKGSIKNPYHPYIYGKGYLGAGRSADTNKKCYKAWNHMLRRCYSEKYHKIQPTYKDAEVCDEWRNYQLFTKWYEANFKSNMDNWQIDKDIIIKNNKIYSPETCCFVPREINALFVRQDRRNNGETPGIRKDKGRFIVTIGIRGERVYLGTFNTKKEALIVHKTAKEKYIKEVADEWKPFITPEVYDAMYAYEVEITD